MNQYQNDFIMHYNRHYIKVNENGCITDVWSDGPHPNKDISDAICINEKASYQVYFFIDGNRTEENPRWLTDDGIPMYRWDGKKVVFRTDEEIKADRAAISVPSPSELERLRADVDFLAAMQGVSL